MATQIFTLENGMTVLLEENHAAKVISFNALIKVGSASESGAEAGICHVIEHMLFKGTPTRPTGTIARDVEAAGGEINAYTSIDQTVFHINMATQFADTGLSILVDAIQNPLFDADELEREKEVILEEIRREQDNPSRMASEFLFECAFKHHTYGRPIIGSPKTVKAFTREQILDFYRRWYSPRNIAFIAVGDFETKKMLDDLKKVFSQFQGPDAPVAKIGAEPPQKRASLSIKAMNVQSTYLSLGFHVPGITHEDVPALDVLAHIMGGADSSRLEQEIKEKRHLVHNVYAYSFTPKDPGLFVVGAMLSDKDADKAMKAIREQIEKMKTEPVTSEELSRAKLNIRSNEIYEKQTVGGQASKLAYFLSTAGSHEFESRYYQMLSDVSAKTVLDAANKYISFSNCTAIALVPENSKWMRSKAPLAKMLEDGTRRSSKAGMPLNSPRTFRLKNGATLIVRENHNLPLVSLCAAAPGGTRFETAANNGISVLMTRTLTKGTTTRSYAGIARDIEKIAGDIDGFSGRNTVGVKADFLSEHLRDGMELFADVLIRPSFSKEEVEKERRVLIQAIRDQEDALSSLAFAEFLKTLFPKHHYGLRVMGTIESAKRLKRGELVRFHKSLIKSGNLVMAVVGDVNAEEVAGLANGMLSDLPRGKSKDPIMANDPPPSAVRESSVIKRNKQQAHIVLGFRGTTFKNPNRYSMTVLNNILAGQGGRLFATLRDKMSLAYAVSSINQEGIDTGHFAIYIGTDPVKQKRAIEGIITELGKLIKDPVSADELERSKQYLVGTYELDLQKNSTLAGLYAFNEIYGLNIKEIEEYPQKILAVNREDVLKAARRYIKLNAYTLAVVKPG